MSPRETLLGLVPSLTELFTDLQFCRQVVTEKEGSYTLHPKGHFFVNLPGSVRYDRSTASSYFLYARPTEKLLEVAKPFGCGGRTSSFEVIPWQAQGVALVLARDRHHLANVRCAFIPITEIPAPEALESMGLPR